MTETDEQDQELQAAELEKIQLENQKLQLEVEKLRKSSPWQSTASLVTTIIGVLTFGFAVWRFHDEGQKTRAVARETEKQKRMEPWLASQRATYYEALSAASAAASSSDPKTFTDAKQRFLTLYHGPMALVETRPIAIAMSDVKAFVDQPDRYTEGQKAKLVLTLATRMHDSLANTASMSFDEFARQQFRYGDPTSKPVNPGQ